MVLDAEATARDARQEADAYRAAREENVRAIFLDEEENKLSGIHIPYKEKLEDTQAAGLQKVVASEAAAANAPEEKQEKQEDKNEAPAMESGYVEEKNIKELKELSEIRAEIISAEKANSLHVIGNNKDNNAAPAAQAKVVPITDAVRNPDKSMTELTATDPVSQNKQIIEMHKAGKSNMVIARELGLGIGEVKLVIYLSNKHRKVK